MSGIGLTPEHLAMNQPMCAHLTVRYNPIKNGNGTASDRWTCDSCQHDFWPKRFPAPWATQQEQSAIDRTLWSEIGLAVGRIEASLDPAKGHIHNEFNYLSGLCAKACDRMLKIDDALAALAALADRLGAIEKRLDTAERIFEERIDYVNKANGHDFAALRVIGKEIILRIAEIQNQAKQPKRRQRRSKR